MGDNREYIESLKKEILMWENDAKILRKHSDYKGARMCYKEIHKLKRELSRYGVNIS